MKKMVPEESEIFIAFSGKQAEEWFVIRENCNGVFRANYRDFIIF